MSIYISNAFSCQMISDVTVVRPVTTEEVKSYCVIKTYSKLDELGAVSVVGHPDIARIIGRELNCSVPVNRVSVKLEKGDTLYIGQYVGARLPEGATELPEGATVMWFKALYTLDPLEVACAEADSRKRKLDRVHPELMDFLAEESVQYEGYPDEKGRDEFAQKLGVSRKIFDELVS